jgi:predicted XRE-type DNA-binding protein
MKEEPLEIVRGSGNAFADLGCPNPEIEQLKALLAAEIIGVLDDQELTVRKAEEITNIAAADFSRIRKVKLGRFTIDRLMIILKRLDQDIDVSVTVHPHQISSASGASRSITL